MNYNNLVSYLLEANRIAGTAILDTETGRVIKGRPGELHVNIYDRLVKKLARLKRYSIDKAANIFNKKFGKRFTSGFVDDAGKFYNREDAHKLRYNGREGLLYSEEL